MKSYFDDFLEVANASVPLLIKEVSWDNIALYMGGDNWHFNTLGDWVVVNDVIMIKGCHDSDAELYLKEMIGRSIIRIERSKEEPSYDPILVIDNGLRVRIFSTSVIDPWTFKFGVSSFFVASPSDDDWNG
ncbi:hypothetical protein [Paraflavitalea sp. CAU 1676]|uniref:hypothetical protein n=1 Tax=Paraflavitalea sp. CAU 1676 TaxID=3032598 RepID=UPI0023DB0519|nr:hypothetical protein [Paraflavitalea sp. CAU 1676]MDF2191607.1 hypothetical protein [Paraflavitalea sp. CAU 1676]